MTNQFFSQEQVKCIIEEMGLSNRKFCRETGVNRGDLSRFMRGLKPLSDSNNQKIYNFARKNGFYSEQKKSLLKRIVDFIKG